MKRLILPTEGINSCIELPGSKYLANRLVIIAALAGQSVILRNVVSNDDIDTAIAGLNALGYHLERKGSEVLSQARSSPLSQPAQVYTSHSGTFSRFVSAVASLQSVAVTLGGSEKMNTRPMAELFDALTQLGVTIEATNHLLPATITGPWRKHHCRIDASKSSQYVSALLLAAPTVGQKIQIDLVGKEVSTQYIDMTVALMKQFGAQAEKRDAAYVVPAQQGYGGGEFTIPPDPVSSSYFMAAAAINGGRVTLNTFDFDSLQGEAQFYKVLEDMGCSIERQDRAISVCRSGELRAVDKDMGEMPDVVQTMSAVACFAKGTTVMRNIAHLAYKESNRLVDTATELQKLGAKVEYGSDYLAVTGSDKGKDLSGTLVETYDDHRMAMSMALIGSAIPNVVINEANVVSKSFPNYFDKLREIGVGSTLVE